ncbi:MAG: hypothetical protein P4M09_22545 [Devosia sp.]|nr:hypothetical protein [Devosia sp.]
MLRDLHNNLDFKRGLAPVAATTDNTAYVSQILDMQGLTGAEFVILTGSLSDADATFAVLAEEGDQANLSDNTAIDDTNLLGTEVQAGFTFADDNKVFKLGIRPSGKRYKRITITPANNVGNVFIAGVWVTSPLMAPTANPPV